MYLRYFFIGLGGALGAILRVFISRFLPSFFFNIPLKILFINVIGCFILGILTQLMAVYWHPSINVKHFMIQGILGGFTTFSAFALEFGLLYEKGFYTSAITYSILSIVLSVVLFFSGIKIIKIFL